MTTAAIIVLCVLVAVLWANVIVLHGRIDAVRDVLLVAGERMDALEGREP